MKGDWYPDLVKVFYNNLKFVDGDIKSRVKGVDVFIDDFIWMLFTSLKAKGVHSYLSNSEFNLNLKKSDLYLSWIRIPQSHSTERLYEHEGLKKEEKIIAHILSWVILLGRLVHDRMTTEDVYLMHAIINKIPN